MLTFAQKPKASKKRDSAKSSMPGWALSGQNRDMHPILHLQRTIGNQAVQRLIQANPGNLEASAGTTKPNSFGHSFSRISVYPKVPAQLQTKLTVNTPGDKYEQEAGRVAKQVMSMPDAEVKSVSLGREQIQRKCTACESGEKTCQQYADKGENIQLKPFSSQITSLVQRQPLSEESLRYEDEKKLQAKEIPGAKPGVTPEIAMTTNRYALRGGGQPLPEATRRFFEPRFRTDFRSVRVHTDKHAAKAAQALSARAFTLGNNMVFGARQFSPETSDGKNLLAHELTHTIQQTSSRRQISGTHIQRAMICSKPLENHIGRKLGLRHAYIDDTGHEDCISGAGEIRNYAVNKVVMGSGSEGCAVRTNKSDDPKGKTPRGKKCIPKPGVKNLTECFKKAYKSYPDPSRYSNRVFLLATLAGNLPFFYDSRVKNSNTFAYNLANECCINSTRAGLGIVPGWGNTPEKCNIKREAIKLGIKLAYPVLGRVISLF